MDLWTNENTYACYLKRPPNHLENYIKKDKNLALEL